MPPKKKVIQKAIPNAVIPAIIPIVEANNEPAVDQKPIVLVKFLDHGDSPNIIYPTQAES
jgi:hypothetical protein